MLIYIADILVPKALESPLTSNFVAVYLGQSFKWRSAVATSALRGSVCDSYECCVRAGLQQLREPRGASCSGSTRRGDIVDCPQFLALFAQLSGIFARIRAAVSALSSSDISAGAGYGFAGTG